MGYIASYSGADRVRPPFYSEYMGSLESTYPEVLHPKARATIEMLRQYEKQHGTADMQRCTAGACICGEALSGVVLYLEDKEEWRRASATGGRFASGVRVRHEWFKFGA